MIQRKACRQLIDVVYSYCSKWRLGANVRKSAVMVFSKDAVNGCRKWGEYSLLIVSSYSYLGTLIFLEMEPGIYAYKEVIR